MDQISAEEGISAEQIVVKITDQGYVTSHGDHYHFTMGKFLMMRLLVKSC